jgi:hypothetical protein
MRRSGGLALLLCTLAWSATALAQRKPPSTGPSEATTAYEEARTRFKDGDYKGSLEALERAQKLSPDPRLFWNMAACEKKLGHYARAIGDVERYLTSGASVLTDEEKRDAAQFLAAAKAFVGRVMVLSNVDGTEVVVDDVLLGTTPLQKPIVVDEGPHHVRFVRAGHATVDRTEQVPAGSDLSWAVELRADAPVPPPATPSAEQGRSRSPLRVGPLVLAGVGVAMAGVGTVLVGVTLSEASKIDAECGTSCPPSRWEKYRTTQVVGDVLLAAGGAAIAGGVVWWLVPAPGGVAAGGRF